MNAKVQIPSINFHLWEPCNMRCKYCFATFQDVKQTVLPKGHLPKEQALNIVKLVAQAGFEKITFAGGEPTLCPWLYDLVDLAHNLGLTTMIVTNGTRIRKEWITKYKDILRWLTLSVDSLYDDCNIDIGRAIVGKRAIPKQHYWELIDLIKESNIRLKLNTVVSSVNYNEDMVEFIRCAKPERWKLLQVLPINGQNDAHVKPFLINEHQFQLFVDKHKTSLPNTKIIAESNDLMKSSYAMLDPAGRFFDNTTGQYLYSDSVLDVGVEKALSTVQFLHQKFNTREGVYDWK